MHILWMRENKRNKKRKKEQIEREGKSKEKLSCPHAGDVADT